MEEGGRGGGAGGSGGIMVAVAAANLSCAKHCLEILHQPSQVDSITSSF